MTAREAFGDIGYTEKKTILPETRTFGKQDAERSAIVYVAPDSAWAWEWNGGSFLDGAVRGLTMAEKKAAEKAQEEMRAEDGTNHD